LLSKIYQEAAEVMFDIEQKNDYTAIEKYVICDISVVVCFIIYDREFDEHAAQIIDECYLLNEEFGLQVLTTKSELYFGYSPLDLAEETNSCSFLATKCMQKHLDRLWYGDINYHGYQKIYIHLLVSYTYFKLLTCLLF
jgi:hypothetical protein